MPPDHKSDRPDVAISVLTAPLISIPDLPEDVFLLILKGLSAWDVISCQRVNKSWRAAFSKDEYIRFVLQAYQRAREVRALSPGSLSFHSAQGTGSIDWNHILLTVAFRYNNLAHGRARKINRYPMAPLEQLGDFFAVGQWDYHESQPCGRLYYETAAMHLKIGAKPYLFRPTLWSYDDGLLVYAPAICEGESYGHFPQVLALLDVGSGTNYPVPFNARSKIIRNLRLKNRTLIIEWAEKDPFHNLNAMEQVNRHFANCYDILRDNDRAWMVAWRSEWKMHLLGLPPNYHDRFFSTHNATHYAVYFWQPNRSMYTGDEELPIESLSIWDISAASSYQPSTDPSGAHRPSDKAGPHIVSRYSFNQLDFFGIRQRSTVSLMSLHLDSEVLSLTVRENVGVAGQGYFDPAERLWCAKTTTFPFVGQGPRLHKEWDGNLPPYRGHCSMESVDVEESERWFLPVMDVADPEASVRFNLIETCFSGHSMENKLIVRVKLDAEDDEEKKLVTLEDELITEVSCMGRIAGDERWLIGQNKRLEIVVLKF